MPFVVSDEPMLRRDVQDLASKSLAAAIIPRREAFPEEIHEILVEAAAKNVVGGPTVTAINRAAVSECELRVGIAAAELQRAAESKGIRYRKELVGDLGTALEEITQDICDSVQGATVKGLSAFPGAGTKAGMLQSVLQMTRHTSLARKRTDLEHYAESLHTKQRERAREYWLKIWQAIVLLIVGAIIGWLAHKIGMT